MPRKPNWMGIHSIHFFDGSDPEIGLHELTDVAWYCSAFCMDEALRAIEVHRGFRTLDKHADEVEFADGKRGMGAAIIPSRLASSSGGGLSYGAFPGGSETDYCVYCDTCETHLWCGLSLEEPCKVASTKA